MIIRTEEKHDYDEVYRLIKTAFSTAEHSDGEEHNLVVRLRKSDAFVPSLSIVAVAEGKLVGHIMFTEITLGDVRALALAPLAILPEYQKQGIGTQLIEEGHRRAKELGYQFSVVLGSEQYYPRMGYVPASDFEIYAPFDVPTENFMAICLQGDVKTVHATVGYAKEFFEQ